MSESSLAPASMWHAAQLWFFRLAASGLLPARWFLPEVPARESRAAKTGHVQLEIVSHCWRYSQLLAYQLSSLVNFPPQRLSVTMTVFHAAEDEDTVALLKYFGAISVPGVRWNWRALDKGRLFRRAIGRNLAARSTDSDWIWFTDCDLVFHRGCLDGLAEALQGRRDALVHPREERVSPLLPESDPTLVAGRQGARLVDIDAGQFVVQRRDRATGPLQITHGDVARACGYCDSLRVYQQPAARWAKAHEDRAFRWLLRTQGEALDVPGVYRIRHLSKGRYQGSRISNLLRTTVRRLQSWWRDRADR